MFEVLTTHPVVANKEAGIIRSGKSRIEINPDYFQDKPWAEWEAWLIFELTRVLLGHPYQRKLLDTARHGLASVAAVQEILSLNLPLPFARDLPLAVGAQETIELRNMEWYYDRLPPNPALPGGAPQGKAAWETWTGSQTALWEDSLSGQEFLLSLQEQLTKMENWGTLPGSLKEFIKKALKPPMDYRALLRCFAAGLYGAQNWPSRLRPSRRFGWLQPGKRLARERRRILFAVDVSGSMTTTEVAHGFGVLKGFLDMGSVDPVLLTFDTQVTSVTPKPSRRTLRNIVVQGRGGTNLQAPLDFAALERHPFDAVVVFTDGIASKPRLPPRLPARRVLWLLSGKQVYQAQDNLFDGIGWVVHVPERSS